MAPEMPTAIYKFGAIVRPVCPTCSWCGRQCSSATGRLQAVAAPRACARFSINPQLSGPFKPRPPLTTTSASLNGTSPEALFTDLIFTLGASTVAVNGTTSAEPLPSVTWYELGLREITFISELMLTLAKAFPEKTFFFTVKHIVSSSG